MKNISSRHSSGKPAASSKKKVVYRMKNWSAYNRSLVQRGDLTVWLRQEAIDGWRYDGPRPLVAYRTGLKRYGEGEWQVRQHGWTQRRAWRKPHLGFDAQTDQSHPAYPPRPRAD